MTKNKHFSVILVIVCVMMLGVILTGCSQNNEGKTPSDIIKDAYGDKAYTISFNSETLDKPIQDIEYTANKIVQIPTPQKVGYIFEGWFFDKELLMPYSDGALLLMMQDVTLYPKWSKERFVHNGTYEIEFETHILEDTVIKGTTTDKYGGYADFGDALMKEDCHIEKSDDDLLLKLQFDTRTVVPFSTAGKVFDVAVSSKMDTGVRITNRIDSLSEPIKTIFIKINDMDLTSTLYLDIAWMNYENSELDETNRYDTLTKYQLAFDLTKIIGFSESFADIKGSLEEGYYLAKSYFRKENNEESMGSVFNPVYSYIYSDGNKHYKLIKQNMPYLGIVAEDKPLLQPLSSNFYDPFACFVATTMAFDIECKDKTRVTSSQYYPETYKGGYYHNSVTEFHADTCRFYNIIDLDPDLTKEYIALTAISGYMERNDGMGYIRQILSIDYDNLIKLPECDYKPLEGDCYEYEDSFSFYPGNYNDLNQKNIPFDVIKKNGMSMEMPNFYYEAENKNSNINDRKVLSSKVTVTPTKKTNAKKVSDSRYEVAEFDVNACIYGHDNSKKLFLDRMSPQIFEGAGYNNQLRDVREIKTGKSCLSGEIIKLENLFKQKVSKKADFSSVKIRAYEINNNKIDKTKTVQIKNKQLQFTRDVAVEFSYDNGGGISTTIVELKDLGKPKITSVSDVNNWQLSTDNHYTKSEVNKVGENVPYPRVSYKWAGYEAKLIDNFYGKENGLSINPTKAMIFMLDDGYYKLDLSLSHTTEFSLKNKNELLMYELNNEFNERDYIYFDYISSPRLSYQITDSDGVVVADKNVKFKEQDHSRISVNEVITRGTFYDEITPECFKDYTHTEDGVTEPYTFAYYNINSSDGTSLYNNPTDTNTMVTTVNNYLKDKAFGSISLVYVHKTDTLTVNYLYKVTFDGKQNFTSLNNEVYFTNTPYLFKKNALVGSNMQEISSLRFNVDKLIDGKVSTVASDYYTKSVEDQGYQYAITFKEAGTYQITATYYVDTAIMGDYSYQNEKYIFTQIVEVKSNLSDIKVVYKTDRYHPFKDGTTEREFIYNLSSNIEFLPFNRDYFDLSIFSSDSSVFPYDRSKDSLYAWSTTTDLTGKQFECNSKMSGKDFIAEFNTDKIELYAIWENKFTVNCVINGNVTKVNARIDGVYDKYVIEYPIQSVKVPSGYTFEGFTGGFIGNTVDKSEKVYLPYASDYYNKNKYNDDYFTITAVFKNIQTGKTTTTPTINTSELNVITKGYNEKALPKEYVKSEVDLCY